MNELYKCGKTREEIYAELEESTNQVLLHWALEKMAQNKEEKVDIRQLLHGNVSPAKLVKLLESMHWTEYDTDSNGWQQDTWITMCNPTFSFDITIFYSGFYGDLEIYRADIDD